MTHSLATELYTPKPRLLHELGALRDAARLPRQWRTLRDLPRGRGRVIVIPGFMTSDRITWPLRQFIARLGYEVQGWGLGRNTGVVWEVEIKLRQMIEAMTYHGPVHLVGWSLGGYMAREVARESPGSVKQVITLASPVIGGPKYTASSGYLRTRSACVSTRSHVW